MQGEHWGNAIEFVSEQQADDTRFRVFTCGYEVKENKQSAREMVSVVKTVIDERAPYVQLSWVDCARRRCRMA